MSCRDFSIELSIYKCNPDGTRDIKFTLTGGPDEDVEYRIDFDNDYVADSHLISHPAGGMSSFIHTYASGESHKFRILYEAGGRSCHQDYSFTLPACCDIYIIGRISDSVCKEGEAVREVTLGVRNIGPTSVDVDFDYGDDSDIISSTIPSGEAVLFPHHDYNAETTREYTVTATVTNQAGCNVRETIRVERCTGDECQARITASATPDDDCNDDGTRDVDFSIHNAGTTEATVVVDFGDGTSSDETRIPAGGPPISVPSHPYPATSTADYTATVNIISPSGCDPVEVPFTVEECPIPQFVCPVPDIDISWGACRNNRRSVNVDAILTHDGTIDAILLLNGEEVAHESGTDEITLSGSTTALAGTSLNTEVVFNEPSGCGPISIDEEFPSCGQDKQTEPESDCSGLCWTLAILIVLDIFVAAAAAALVVSPPIALALGVLAIILGIAILAIALALFFCTLAGCNVSRCVLMGFSLALTIVGVLAILMAFGLLPDLFTWLFIIVAGAAAAAGVTTTMAICAAECEDASCGLFS